LGGGEPQFIDPCDRARVGASPLARGGYLVRLLANRAADLEATLGRLHAEWWKS